MSPSDASGSGVAPSPGRPLASGGAPGDNAREISDWTLATRELHFRATATTSEPFPLDGMHDQVRASLTANGFRVADDNPPKVPAHRSPKAPSDRSTVWGWVVAERDRTVDQDRVRTTRNRLCLFLAIVPVDIAIIIAVASFGTPARPVQLLIVSPLAICMAAALILWGSLNGTFDSTVASVYYQDLPESVAGTEPITGATSLRYRITVRVGRVVTQNWQGKSGSGRQFKLLLPSDPALSNVPGQIRDSLVRATSN